MKMRYSYNRFEEVIGSRVSHKSINMFCFAQLIYIFYVFNLFYCSYDE